MLTDASKKGLTDFFRSELEALEAKIGRVLMGSSFGSCRIMELAPVLVMVWNASERGWETEVHSVAAAIQNMLLKAYGLGLGSLWVGNIYYAKEALERHLGKPWKLMAAITLGWPKSIPSPPSKKPVEEVSEYFCVPQTSLA